MQQVALKFEDEREPEISQRKKTFFFFFEKLLENSNDINDRLHSTQDRQLAANMWGFGGLSLLHRTTISSCVQTDLHSWFQNNPFKDKRVSKKFQSLPPMVASLWHAKDHISTGDIKAKFPRMKRRENVHGAHGQRNATDWHFVESRCKGKQTQEIRNNSANLLHQVIDLMSRHWSDFFVFSELKPLSGNKIEVLLLHQIPLTT